MVKLIVALVATVLLFGLVAGQYPSGVCTRVGTWKEACNWCRCTNKGLRIVCTRLNCNAKPVSRQTRTVFSKSRLDIAKRHALGPCEPGSRTTMSCNICTCSSDGQNYACTRRICREKRAVSYQECVPGTFRFVDCNRCNCLPSGIEVCTRTACPNVHREERATPTRCTPGQSVQVGCNTCTCGPDGYPLACTLKACFG